MISRGVSSDEKPSETLQPAWAYQLAGRQAGGGGIPKRHGLETQTSSMASCKRATIGRGQQTVINTPFPFPFPSSSSFFFRANSPVSIC